VIDEGESVAITIDDIYLRDGGTCGICGEPVLLKQASVDHIIPRSKGGKDCLHNTQTAHLICNKRKRATMPDSLPEDCDCPAPEPAEERPRDSERFGPVPKKEWALKPEYMHFAVKAGVTETGVPCALMSVAWPNYDAWTFHLTFEDLDKLAGEIHAVRGILTLHNFELFLASRNKKA
jgi:hypothetical protein